LMETTDWSAYGRASGNPKCQQCMAHCGYEPAAVEATFGSWRGSWRTARLMLLGAPDQPAVSPSPAPQPRLPRLPIVDPVPAERVA
jgi:hypothetical protein